MVQFAFFGGASVLASRRKAPRRPRRYPRLVSSLAPPNWATTRASDWLASDLSGYAWSVVSCLHTAQLPPLTTNNCRPTPPCFRFIGKLEFYYLQSDLL